MSFYELPKNGGQQSFLFGTHGAGKAVSELNDFIKAYDMAIEHYDFVLNDLSGEIYNPQLQAAKAPVIQFLKAMKGEWQACRDAAQKQLDVLQ